MLAYDYMTDALVARYNMEHEHATYGHLYISYCIFYKCNTEIIGMVYMVFTCELMSERRHSPPCLSVPTQTLNSDRGDRCAMSIHTIDNDKVAKATHGEWNDRNHRAELEAS